MQLNLLGPVELSTPRGPVPITAAKPRALLAVLGLSTGVVVSSTRLIDLLWDGDPPDTAANTLQYHVSVLRRSLGDGAALQTRPAGYQLDLPTDLQRFDSLTGRARSAGSPAERADLAARAIALWRGPALADLGQFRSLAAIAVGLDERRLGAAELWASAQIDLDPSPALIESLVALTAEQPTRERLWELLMLAQYRAGRQGDALAAFQRARDLLADLVGVDPGSELRDLHARILAQDPRLDAPRRPAPPRPARPGGRLADPVATVASTLVRSSMVTGAARLVDMATNEHLALRRGRLVIGRADQADLKVADAKVSRFHAAIEPAGAGHRLRDLASTNGTLLNGTPVIEPTMLADGDVIQAGARRWEYRIDR